MATVQYKSKENTGRKSWTARFGRYAMRIDAKQPGVHRCRCPPVEILIGAGLP